MLHRSFALDPVYLDRGIQHPPGPFYVAGVPLARRRRLSVLLVALRRVRPPLESLDMFKFIKGSIVLLLKAIF